MNTNNSEKVNKNKRKSQNIITNKKNNIEFTKRLTKQYTNNKFDINKIYKHALIDPQKNIEEKEENEIENKEANLNENNNNNETVKENNSIKKNINKKIISYNLKLSKEELDKIINNQKINPSTSKVSKSQSNDNIQEYNKRNKSEVALRFLNEKQKSLHDMVKIINLKKNYIKECSLYNLSEKNAIIYKNIQNDKMKSLNIKEKNFLEKIDSIQHQINNISAKNAYNNIKKIENKKDEKNKDNEKNDYESKFLKLKLENQKIYENNFKNADLNLEKKLNEIKQLEKSQKEQKKKEIMERIKRTHSLEQKHLEAINSEVKKNKNFIKNRNKRGSKENYLYFKLEKTFERKEKMHLDNSKTKKNSKEDIKKKEKEKKEYMVKKRKELKENIKNLHKMWKEINSKLPKYRSPLYSKSLLSEEDSKKIQNDKLEAKKLLYINKETYGKEKIQLPPINYLYKKEISQRKELIKNIRLNNNNINNLKTMKVNSPRKEKNIIKSYSTISSSNIQNFQNNSNNKRNNIKINISLKKQRTKYLKMPNDFNYLEEIKRKRLLKNYSEDFLLTNKNKRNQPMDIEKEKMNTELLEQKYNMDKKLLKVKGGYINNPELVNNMNKILIKTIENKLDIYENMVE